MVSPTVLPYDEESHTLTLDDYDGGPIEITGIGDDFTIVVNGENVIDSESDYGIHSDGPLNIEGDGTITVEASESEHWTYGCIIDSSDNLTINSGVINVVDNTEGGEGGICASGDININGGEVNVSTDGVGIISRKGNGNINLNGGQVNISSEYLGLRVYGGTIHFNGAEVNVTRNHPEGEPCTDVVTESDYIKIDKGTINTDCVIYSDVVVINGGTVNAVGINANLLNQNGGKLNISGTGTEFDGEHPFAIYADFTVFNGGTANIDNTPIGIYTENDYDENEKAELAEKAKKIGGVMPKAAYIEFNGGDVTIEGSLAPIIVASDTASTNLEKHISLSENMVKDPDYATLDQADYMGAVYMTMFSDGEGDVEIIADQTAGTIVATHAIKKIHIYYQAPPAVPNTDNPNTLDYQIIGLAGAVFIAVMAQGMIIADLYRRLHGYEEEIATEADGGNAMMDNEPVEQAQAEEQPAEEVDVKFEKHDKTDDYSGPGDEYYY